MVTVQQTGKLVRIEQRLFIRMKDKICNCDLPIRTELERSAVSCNHYANIFADICF